MDGAPAGSAIASAGAVVKLSDSLGWTEFVSNVSGPNRSTPFSGVEVDDAFSGSPFGVGEPFSSRYEPFSPGGGPTGAGFGGVARSSRNCGAGRAGSGTTGAGRNARPTVPRRSSAAPGAALTAASAWMCACSSRRYPSPELHRWHATRCASTSPARSGASSPSRYVLRVRRLHLTAQSRDRCCRIRAARRRACAPWHRASTPAPSISPGSRGRRGLAAAARRGARSSASIARA